MSNSLVVGNYTNTTSTISSSTFSNNNQHTITNCTIAHNKKNNNGEQNNHDNNSKESLSQFHAKLATDGISKRASCRKRFKAAINAEVTER